jgi:hypothetical protein
VVCQALEKGKMLAPFVRNIEALGADKLHFNHLLRISILAVVLFTQICKHTKIRCTRVMKQNKFATNSANFVCDQNQEGPQFHIFVLSKRAYFKIHKSKTILLIEPHIFGFSSK